MSQIIYLLPKYRPQSVDSKEWIFQRLCIRQLQLQAHSFYFFAALSLLGVSSPLPILASIDQFFDESIDDLFPAFSHQALLYQSHRRDGKGNCEVQPNELHGTAAAQVLLEFFPRLSSHVLQKYLGLP